MYQIYALKYAERDTTACQFFYREHSHEPITLHYFVWLILGGPHPVLVDTGFQEDDVERRGIRNYVRPSVMVERMGVKVADIPIALISHLHYDHWAGHRLFPASEFWIQPTSAPLTVMILTSSGLKYSLKIAWALASSQASRAVSSGFIEAM